MRFTKIPLIATLMAVALSLLIVLPGLAQSQNYDDTRGHLSGGSSLTVAVLSGVDDDHAGVTPNVDESLSGSYFNGTLYVSNFAGTDDAPAAYNTVRITATGGDRTEFAGPDGALKNVSIGTDNGAAIEGHIEEQDNIDCAVATVKNNRSNKRITVRLANAAQGETAESVIFAVVSNGLEEYNNGDRECGEEAGERVDTTEIPEIQAGTPPTQDQGNLVPDSADAMGARMPARHGDTLTITVAGVAGSVTLTVDAEGPEFTEISPPDGQFLSSQTVKFRFVVTDTDSGLAHDGELDYTRGDLDARAFNTDDDNFTTQEPRSLPEDRSSTPVGPAGASRDIQVMLGDKDESANGSSGWRQRGGRPGVSYFLDMAVTNVQEGTHEWHLSATDRAGNTARTKASDKEPDFKLVVDVSSPEFKDARTGISYDPDKKKETVNRSYIAMTFEDSDGPFDAVKDVDVDKFLVEDAEVVGFIHLSDKSDCGTEAKPVEEKKKTPKDIDGDCIDQTPQSRVYLELAEPLAPDAAPQVSMFGGAVLDLAGNPSNQDEIIAADNIAPAITVTLTTDVGDRPVIRNNGEVTISITSDEELRRLPQVHFAQVLDNGSDADEVKAKLGASRRGERVSTDAGAENSWSRTYTNTHIGSTDGLYAVIVIAEDDDDNIGATPGWTRDRQTNAPSTDGGASLDDLSDAGLLVEIDKETDFADEPFALAPEAGEDSDETESSSPFITIDFGAEAGEYDSSSKFFKSDSHSAVEIVSITLNGNDVSDRVAEVKNNKYTLAAQDLATGDYELKVTGRDDAGNEVSDDYDFEVVDRSPYKLSLIPGWNLVSLPGTPLDSSIGVVMGDSMQASIVLAYQDDAWLTAVNDSGTWRGTLTDITGGYGYWVQTTAFESISALIPETDTSSVLPTARVIKGWNLLGVVDVLQAKAGSAPSGGADPDAYFDNISWKVAYSFDTSSNQWAKSIPKGGDEGIANGKGYWVWSTAAGVLVP